MSIKLKKKPTIPHTSDFEMALVDADLIAFAVAAASDGHFYAVINPDTHELLVKERYKKDINKWFKENPEVPTAWLTDDYEPEDIKTVTHSVKQMITSILTDIGARDYKLFLSGGKNFRHEVNPEYKANRKEVRRPYHLKNTQQYLTDVWGAEKCVGIEADDAIGTAQDDLYKAGVTAKTTVAASIDKDFFCFPGWHYNWPHHGKDAVLKYITPEEARLNFYKQVLTGDKTDNIIGLKGIGPAKANTIVKGSKSTSNEDLYRTVLLAYQKHQCLVRAGFKSLEKRTTERVLKVAQQIWILQEEGVMWEAPVS